ncbi:MAG: helix-turn-helix transcriptional regulator [Acutalibacteraceae bacterium]|nr:helix-turn-helix transcriptional regulator [Acutalibacteraceae bacterium]
MAENIEFKPVEPIQFDRITFAKRLKEARNNAGLTQNELANLTNISTIMVSAYENPNAKSGKNPTLSNVFFLASALNVSIDWLCGISVAKEPNRGGDLSTKNFLLAIGEMVNNFDEFKIVPTLRGGENAVQFEFLTVCQVSKLENFINEYLAVQKLKNSLEADTYTSVMNTVIDKYSSYKINELINSDIAIAFEGVLNGKHNKEG